MRPLPLLLALCPALAVAAVPSVQITGRIAVPDGSPPVKGTITCKLSQPGTILDGATTVQVREEVTFTLSNGAFPASAKLVPNKSGAVGAVAGTDFIAPAGTAYRCTPSLQLPNGRPVASSVESIQVDGATASIDYGAITRVATPGGAVFIAGPKGVDGAPGANGASGQDGVAAASSPLTYDAGTRTVASQAASATQPGHVTTGTQTIAGAKTFRDGVTGSEVRTTGGVPLSALTPLAQFASTQSWAVPKYFPGDANTVLHTTFPGTLGAKDAMGVVWTQQGTPTFTSSTSDRGYVSAFGDTNRLKLPSPNVLDFASNFTLCKHFYPLANPATSHVLLDTSDGGIKGYKVTINSSGNLAFTVCGTSCTINTSAGTVSLNAWNAMCVGAFDGGAFAGAALNGVVAPISGVPGGALNPENGGGGVASLGAGAFGGNIAFPGRISEVWATTTPFSPTNVVHLTEGSTIPTAVDPYSVAVFGDSLQEIGTPTYLRTNLGAPWRVYNEGHSGEMVSTSIWTRWRNYGRYLRAGVVIIDGGINDTQAVTSATAIAVYVTDIADEARATGAKVVIVNLAPFGASTYYSSAKEAVRVAVNVKLSAYCATGAATCVDVSSDLSNGGTPPLLKPADDSGDGLHWNVTGQQRVAALVVPAVLGTACPATVSTPCVCGSAVKTSGTCP